VIRMRPLLALAALSLVACESTPPRVATTWASRARGVRTKGATGEPRSPRAEFGPSDDRDDDDLVDLDGDEGLGDVVIRLEKGTFVLDAPTLLKGASSVTLEGAGTHLTRLELDTESVDALRVAGVARVTLRGLTVVGLSGGGLAFKDCGQVIVEDVHFAGARFGLELVGSDALVGTSVFAGCDRGITLEDGASVEVRETAFVECWKAISGRGDIVIESSIFVDNHDAIDARLDRGGSLVSVAFAGDRQQTAWTGEPDVMRALLLPAPSIVDPERRRVHRIINHRDEFPDRLRDGLPNGFDLAGVHLALLRADLRGEKDPPLAVREEALARAEELAQAAQVALRKGDLDAARAAAREARRYCGPGPLGEDVPAPVREVAELATP
jgi:hypothetical protein